MDDSHLLDGEDAAEYLATTRNHVQRLTRRGELVVVVVGNRYRWRVADLDAFIERNRRTVGEVPTKLA